MDNIVLPAPHDHLVERIIRDFLPDHYHDDPAGLVAFIEAYYEWLATINRNYQFLQYRDIDTTIDDFLIHFRAKYMESIPSDIKADPRLLHKFILDLYRSKGTPRGIRLLFRVVFGIDVDIYFPSEDVLTPSDAEWVIPLYLEISPSIYNRSLSNKVIFGASSGAQATVEGYTSQYVNGRKVEAIYVSNVKGNFQIGEHVGEQSLISTASVLATPSILGSLSAIQFIQGGQNISIGNRLQLIGGSGRSGEVRVTRVGRSDGSLQFDIENGGSGYTANAVPIISRGSSVGSGAGFRIGAVSTIQLIDINTDLLTNIASLPISNTAVASVTVNAGGTGYSNTDTLIFTPSPAIIDSYITSQGIGYSNGDAVIASNSVGSGFSATVETNGSGAIVSVDITNFGSKYDGSPVLSITTSNGSGAVLTPIVYNGGANATATVSTNSTGGIVGITMIDGGVDYLLPPVVTVNTTGGASANLVSHLSGNTVYGFTQLPSANLASEIGDSLTIETIQFGKIASLANVATGSGYTSSANVSVGDYIYTSNGVGNVSFTTSSNVITGNGTLFSQTFVVDDVIHLVDGTKSDHRIVRTVTSNTSMQLDDVPTFSSTANAKYQLSLPMLATNYPSCSLIESDGSIKGSNAKITGSSVYGEGVVKEAVTVDSGFGYRAGDAVQLARYGAVANLQIVHAGNNYSNNDAVVFTGGEGSGASGYVVTNANGNIASVTMVSNGNGYITPPNISVASNTGTGASFIVEVGGWDESIFITGQVITSSIGSSKGRFTSTKSFLNSDKYIQDCFYYQNFSYEIQSDLTLDRFSNSLKTLFHTSGTELFAKSITKDTERLGLNQVTNYIIPPEL